MLTIVMPMYIEIEYFSTSMSTVLFVIPTEFDSTKRNRFNANDKPVWEEREAAVLCEVGISSELTKNPIMYINKNKTIAQTFPNLALVKNT